MFCNYAPHVNGIPWFSWGACSAQQSVCLVLTDACDPTGVKPPQLGNSRALLSIHLPGGLSLSLGFCTLSVPVSILLLSPWARVSEFFWSHTLFNVTVQVFSSPSPEKKTACSICVISCRGSRVRDLVRMLFHLCSTFAR